MGYSSIASTTVGCYVHASILKYSSQPLSTRQSHNPIFAYCQLFMHALEHKGIGVGFINYWTPFHMATVPHYITMNALCPVLILFTLVIIVLYLFDTRNGHITILHKHLTKKFRSYYMPFGVSIIICQSCGFICEQMSVLEFMTVHNVLKLTLESPNYLAST